MRFAYQAFDAAGKAVSGTTEAADQNDAMEILRRQGLYVTSVQATADAGAGVGAGAAGGSTTSSSRRSMSRRKQLKNLAMFTRQLSVLMTSGTPLVQALASLERQTSDKSWRAVVGTLRTK